MEFHRTPGRMYPLFATLAEARCYGCAGHLVEHQRSGSMHGDGEWHGKCAKCGFLTFYDVKDEGRKK